MARGGKRDGAGRPPASADKVTADLKAAAGEYTEAALLVLSSIMNGAAQPAAARVAAANAILDRGHGKPKQAVDIDGTIRATVTRIERQIVRPKNPDR